MVLIKTLWRILWLDKSYGCQKDCSQGRRCTCTPGKNPRVWNTLQEIFYFLKKSPCEKVTELLVWPGGAFLLYCSYQVCAPSRFSVSLRLTPSSAVLSISERLYNTWPKCYSIIINKINSIPHQKWALDSFLESCIIIKSSLRTNIALYYVLLLLSIIWI